jgi:tetratricopeptide (TPR) repeat protein
MKKIIFGLIFFLAIAFPASACLNYYFTLDKEGRAYESPTQHQLITFNTNFNKQVLYGDMLTLTSKLKEQHSYMLLSDYAVDLLKLGKTNEALQVLAQLYAYYPDEYKIASNLGTVYELHGDNDSALKYIRRGIELNPNDHDGSEWIHEKILLAKIALKKDHSWLKHNSVLGLSDVQKNDPAVRQQLFIQIQERFPFTRPVADPIMASLFADLGDLYYNTNSVAIAIVCYRVSRDYFEGTSSDLDYKIAVAEKLNNEQAKIKLDVEVRRGGRAIAATNMNYETCFLDNDSKKYKIGWNQIEADPKALLAMVNLEMTTDQAKILAKKNADKKDALQLVQDSVAFSDSVKQTAVQQTNKADVLPQIQNGKVIPAGKINELSIIAGAVLLAATLLFFSLRKLR